MKRVAGLLFTLGAVAIALLVFRTTPRDVVLVYDLGAVPDATALEVRIEKGSEIVRRAEFPSPGRQVRHEVRLTDGAYHVRVAARRPDAVVQADRDITVTESQTIVLPVEP